jgi:hypothetical protein
MARALASGGPSGFGVFLPTPQREVEVSISCPALYGGSLAQARETAATLLATVEAVERSARTLEHTENPRQ